MVSSEKLNSRQDSCRETIKRPRVNLSDGVVRLILCIERAIG